jgi:diguanylate cyclase (GGDEF)-like protein/PAS domain S-box-containing protein
MNHDDLDTVLPSQDSTPVADQLQLALARTRLQMRVASEVRQAPELIAGDVDALARLVTERAVFATGCAHASVWLFAGDGASVYCVDAYSAATKSHSTSEQGDVASYMQRQGYTSLLETVIRVAGKRRGLLCLANSGMEPAWQADDSRFAEQLADKLGLALVAHQHREAEERLRASEERLRFTNALLQSEIESAPYGVVVIDSRDGLASWNEKFRAMWDLPDFVIESRDPAALLEVGATRVVDPEAFAEEVRRLQSAATMTLERELHFIDGRIIDWDGSWLRAADGSVLGRVNYFRDVTARKRIEQAVRRSEEQLREAQRVARVGSWVWYPDTDEQEYSQELCHMFGLDPAKPVPQLKNLLGIIEPDSFEAMMAAARVALQTGTPYALDMQIRRPDGGAGWLLVRGEAEFDDAGVCRRLRGTAVDITERKAAEQALAYRDRVLHAVMACSVAFVAAESMTQPLGDTLRVLGEALNLDRLSLIKVEGSGEDSRHAHVQSWNHDAVEAVTDDMIAAFVRTYGEKMAALSGRKFVCNTISAATGATRVFYEQAGIKSNITVPIIVNGTYWGHIVADDCVHERAWNTAEIDALKTLAEVVGALLHREQVRDSLRQSEERFRAVSDTAQDAIIMVDADGRIVYWNRAAEGSFGYTTDEVLGHSFVDLIASKADGAHALQTLREFMRTGHGLPAGIVELIAQRSDGAEFPVELSVSAVRLHADWHVVAFVRDISERKRSETFIHHLARHDVLTGLANRHVFVEALDAALLRARRETCSVAVLYLDLDHFKDINDTLGHPVGDLVLKEVAARLLAAARETDTVARFGGDEFAVLLTDFSDPANCATFAERVLTTLAAPMQLGGNEIRTGTSVGIAIYADQGDDAEKLLSQADVALYRAKSEGRGTFRFFTESMDIEVHKRVRLGAELRQALVSNQLSLHYQPQVDIDTGRIVGLEALARWRHPERGLVSPADFIPVAEQTGLIVALGQWTLREACRQVRAWLDAGVPMPLMAINLSGLQFKSPHELETHIGAALSANCLEPHHLELELTESILMDASQDHNDVLLRLRAQGFRIAIDDFGTGYSSLDYLRRFPVDRIKIAQNFIVELTRNSGDAVIVRAALGIARELQIPAIVEGVETREQLELLRGWGCTEVQGYLYARPMPAAEVEALLRQGRIALRA